MNKKFKSKKIKRSASWDFAALTRAYEKEKKLRVKLEEEL